MVANPRTDKVADTEILQADQPGIGADLEVLRINRRFLDAPALDTRIQRRLFPCGNTFNRLRHALYRQHA